MNLLFSASPTPLIKLSSDLLSEAGVRLYVKRDDLIHPEISGNEWRKPKYNLLDANERGYKRLLTFGGAYSNHLYAVAAAGAKLGFETIGIVRGDERPVALTPTLQFCLDQGMHLHYVSRTAYRQRNDAAYLKALSGQFEHAYQIPEGGTTALALKGVAEMVAEVNGQLNKSPDYFAVASGTGGTAAGILGTGANVLAFSALKGADFLVNDIQSLCAGMAKQGKLAFFSEYHFAGYAKWNDVLLQFIRDFHAQYQIRLEQVYTAKMFYGLFDLIRKGHFPPGTTIVAVHTGGMQGLLPELQ